MTFSGLTRAALAFAAATALAVSAQPSHAQQADGPGFGAPSVGTCSTMTAPQAAAAADRSTRVPCAQAHTARVAGVVQLPDRLTYSSPVAKLHRVVVRKCRPKVSAMLGRTNAVRDSSAYDFVWFIPTKDQRRHGARWLSCSIVLRQGTDLARLPTNKTPMLPSGALKDGIHRCLLATISAVVTTRCSAEHGWRATGSFVIASTSFPGTKAVNRAARSKCAARTNPNRSYRWTYWPKLDWQVGGDHAVICYTKTTR